MEIFKNRNWKMSRSINSLLSTHYFFFAFRIWLPNSFNYRSYWLSFASRNDVHFKWCMLSTVNKATFIPRLTNENWNKQMNSFITAYCLMLAYVAFSDWKCSVIIFQQFSRMIHFDVRAIGFKRLIILLFVFNFKWNSICFAVFNWNKRSESMVWILKKTLQIFVKQNL